MGERRTKSDIFFGISILLAILGTLCALLYFADSIREHTLNKYAFLGFCLSILSMIGIYLSVKFEETAEEKDIEDTAEIIKKASENQDLLELLKVGK